MEKMTFFPKGKKKKNLICLQQSRILVVTITFVTMTTAMAVVTNHIVVIIEWHLQQFWFAWTVLAKLLFFFETTRSFSSMSVSECRKRNFYFIFSFAQHSRRRFC